MVCMVLRGRWDGEETVLFEGRRCGPRSNLLGFRIIPIYICTSIPKRTTFWTCGRSRRIFSTSDVTMEKMVLSKVPRWSLPRGWKSIAVSRGPRAVKLCPLKSTYDVERTYPSKLGCSSQLRIR